MVFEKSSAVICLLIVITMFGKVTTFTLDDPGTVNLPENSATNTSVKQLTTASETGAVTYSLTSDEFKINSDTVEVKAGAVLDFEGTKVFSVVITAVDSATPTANTATGTLTVSLTDVNEAPGFAMNNYAVLLDDGSGADTMVGNFTATDPDTGTNGNIAGYSIKLNSYIFPAAGNTDSVFTNTDGVIKIASSKSVDISALPAYILTFEANDAANPSLTGTATINIAVRTVCSGVSGVTAGMTSFISAALLLLLMAHVK